MTCVRCSNKSSLDFITFTYWSCYLYVVYSYYGNEIAVSSGSSSIFIVIVDMKYLSPSSFVHIPIPGSSAIGSDPDRRGDLLRASPGTVAEDLRKTEGRRTTFFEK